jgi:hypothetical protein
MFPRVCQGSLQKALEEDMSDVPVRFPPKDTLQSSGDLNRTQILEFFEKCCAMLQSEETTDLLQKAAEAQRDIGRLSIQWQWQVFESLGIENKFGVQQLGQIKSRFADDTQVITELMRFQETCQITCWKVMGAPTAGREEVLEDIEGIVLQLKGMSMVDKKDLMREVGGSRECKLAKMDRLVSHVSHVSLTFSPSSSPALYPPSSPDGTQDTGAAEQWPGNKSDGSAREA